MNFDEREAEMKDVLFKLGLDYKKVGRPRGYHYEDDRIVFYTRTGGNNEEYFEKQNDYVRSSKYYLYDIDDDMDNTYKNFYFKNMNFDVETSST
jgi:hypothetical protein